MTYPVDHTSVEDSQLVELFDFDLPGGHVLLTSYGSDFTVGSDTYARATISMGPRALAKVGQARETTISIAVDHDLVAQLFPSPPLGATVVVTWLEQRGGATREAWRGPVAGVVLDGELARLKIPSAIDQVFGVSLPFAVASRSCNHGLYDAGCSIARDASRRILPTVATISGTALVISSVSGKPDRWARFGEVVRISDGQRRSVIEQIGTAITLDEPFGEIEVGDALEVWQGCPHDIESCRDLFSNVANFGGHPDLPSNNPVAPTGLGVIVQE